MKYAAFNPSDAGDKLAEVTRIRMAKAMIDAARTPSYRNLSDDPQTRVASVLAGALTAVCGAAIAQMHRDDDAHAEIRAWLIAYLPQAFDQARGIMELPPLPEADQ